jgi:predicted O-methyltransferase YrrM
MTSGLQVPYKQFSEHDEAKLRELSLLADGDMAEIGCWLGHSTSILAQRCKELRTNLYVIDNFKGNEGTPLKEYAESNDVRGAFLDNMKDLGLLDSIVLLTMDSDDAVNLIPNVDLLFIDGGHTYKQVLKDLQNYKTKSRILCGHDYESDTYDESHVEEDYVNGKHHGVIKAVNEVLGKVNHEGRMWWK